MAVCQNLVPLVNIKIAGKWMFIPLKIVLIGIDPPQRFFRLHLLHQSFLEGRHLRIAQLLCETRGVDEVVEASRLPSVLGGKKQGKNGEKWRKTGKMDENSWENPISGKFGSESG